MNLHIHCTTLIIAVYVEREVIASLHAAVEGVCRLAAVLHITHVGTVVFGLRTVISTLGEGDAARYNVHSSIEVVLGVQTYAAHIADVATVVAETEGERQRAGRYGAEVEDVLDGWGPASVYLDIDGLCKQVAGAVVKGH